MTKVEDKDFDDLSIKGTRPIVEAYRRCDLVMLELTNFEKVAR